MPRVLNYELKDFGGIKNLNNQINGLVTENALLKDQIPNGTAEGTNVQITDSSNLPIEDGRLKGDTSQDSTTGKNLANIHVITNLSNQFLSRQIVGETIVLSDNTNSSGFLTTEKKLSQICPNLKVDDVVKLSFNTTTTTSQPKNAIYLAGINELWYINEIKTITQEMLDNTVILYGGYNETTVISEFMIRLSSVTDETYEPYTGGQASPSPAYPQTIHRVTGNCNTNFSDENGEAEQNTPLTLGNIKLCKIGNYQDDLFKNVRTLRSGRANPLFNADLDEGDWYKYEAIGEVVFDGSENWMLETEKIITHVFLLTGVMKNASSVGDCLSNYFKNNVSGDAEKIAIGFGNLYIAINKTTVSTVEQFKTWLSTHNTTVYYQLETPTYTKITDTTLIAQLEAYYNASTYRNVTNIITAGEDLAPIAGIVYKKDLTTLFNKLDSLEARVDLLEE